jgi:TRAP transporter 4TM/12TM fusion protein
VQRAGELTQADMVIGVITLVLVFEAARRIMGLALPLICLGFLAYALFGEYLPGDLAHRGYGLDQVVGQLAFGTEGIYGTPTYVSSSYIFLFILFGAFLEQAGMIDLFTNFALGTVGHTKGGPAKVAVVSSGLMGTINGSGVANVVTTGQFTIPLMKRFGYTPAFAGAVEATSSMGGQIMPPVMGAVAFIMAETINVPYVEIAKAAAIPAMLYFFTVFWMVHLEAGRAGLGPAQGRVPDPWACDPRALVPAAAAGRPGRLLFAGFTPMFAGMVGLALTVVLIFGAAPRAISTAPRCACCSGSRSASPARPSPSSASSRSSRWWRCSRCCWRRADGRDTLRLAVKALVDGALHALPVGVACALVGVIIGIADADRRRHRLCRLHHPDRRRQPVRVAAAHDAGLPGARHGHPDHPELHHHQLDRRARRCSSSACR